MAPKCDAVVVDDDDEDDAAVVEVVDEVVKAEAGANEDE